VCQGKSGQEGSRRYGHEGRGKTSGEHRQIHCGLLARRARDSRKDSNDDPTVRARSQRDDQLPDAGIQATRHVGLFCRLEKSHWILSTDQRKLGIAKGSETVCWPQGKSSVSPESADPLWTHQENRQASSPARRGQGRPQTAQTALDYPDEIDCRGMTSMNGPIAQLVAIACHANAWLQGGEATHFYPSNLSFQFCDSVNFVKLKRRWFQETYSETPIAEDPNAWFKFLDSSGFRAILVHRTAQNLHGISDRMSSAFVGGGGRWFLEANRENSSDFYEARWAVWNPNAPENKIWRVTYGLYEEKSAPRPFERAGLQSLKVELDTALRDIHRFAVKNELTWFAEQFQKGLECLQARDPFALTHYSDLAPQGMLTGESAQLLAAAQPAWVFGGMGSWNDLGFEGDDKRLYEGLSDRLFELLNTIICAVTNSSARSRLK